MTFTFKKTESLEFQCLKKLGPHALLPYHIYERAFNFKYAKVLKELKEKTQPLRHALWGNIADEQQRIKRAVSPDLWLYVWIAFK